MSESSKPEIKVTMTATNQEAAAASTLVVSYSVDSNALRGSDARERILTTNTNTLSIRLHTAHGPAAPVHREGSRDRFSSIPAEIVFIILDMLTFKELCRLRKASPAVAAMGFPPAVWKARLHEEITPPQRLTIITHPPNPSFSTTPPSPGPSSPSPPLSASVTASSGCASTTTWRFRAGGKGGERVMKVDVEYTDTQMQQHHSKLRLTTSNRRQCVSDTSPALHFLGGESTKALQAEAEEDGRKPVPTRKAQGAHSSLSTIGILTSLDEPPLNQPTASCSLSTSKFYRRLITPPSSSSALVPMTRETIEHFLLLIRSRAEEEGRGRGRGYGWCDTQLRGSPCARKAWVDHDIAQDEEEKYMTDGICSCPSGGEARVDIKLKELNSVGAGGIAWDFGEMFDRVVALGEGGLSRMEDEIVSPDEGVAEKHTDTAVYDE
ncbi:hypothetical protein DFH27DRAFT_656563 [Peziza echinospora]|nr:hypothetical protein DFH27DRAFT_656563 [Peziza echinospora]